MNDILTEVLAAELGVQSEIITDDLKYNSIPEWESTSHMIIVLALEDRFNVEFESDDIVNMTSLPKIRKMLQDKGIKA